MELSFQHPTVWFAAVKASALLRKNAQNDWEVDLLTQRCVVSDATALARLSEEKGPITALLTCLSRVDGLGLSQTRLTVEDVAGSQVLHGEEVASGEIPIWYEAASVRCRWSAGGCVEGSLRAVLQLEGKTWTAQLRECSVSTVDSTAAVHAVEGIPGLIAVTKDAITRTSARTDAHHKTVEPACFSTNRKTWKGTERASRRSVAA